MMMIRMMMMILLVMIRLILMRMRMKMTMMIIDMGQRVLTSQMIKLCFQPSGFPANSKKDTS